MRILIISILVCLAATTGFSTLVNQIGTYNNWSTNWTAISGGTDGADQADATADYVGDASNPGLYYANNGSYVFFRMRINADTFTTAPNAYILLFDIANYGVTGIDYAFCWDAKSKVVDHGLEMGIAGANGPTWGVAQMDDIDGAPASKTTLDINGAGRTTDGYVRTTDRQATTSFGDTTLIDFAVSWSYLQANTNMRSNQTWNVALASIVNATDHNKFSEFGNGIQSADSISTGWAAIPEPATDLLLVLGGGITWVFSRRKRR
jgi:hypothetical protein